MEEEEGELVLRFDLGAGFSQAKILHSLPPTQTLSPNLINSLFLFLISVLLPYHSFLPTDLVL